MPSPDYCRNKAAPEGSSLYYSLLFLDPPRRQAITAIHAFKEEIGDIVRNSADVEPAYAKLAWWRMEIDALFGHRPSHPVTRDLAIALAQFPIAQEYLVQIIDGYETDIRQGGYPDYKALQLYCFRVASTVSTMDSEILGYRDRQTTEFAHELGLAMQLTELIRNAGSHARHGRIYIPLDELEQFGVSVEDITNARHSANVESLLAFQTKRIHALYESALSRLAGTDRKSQRPLLALANIQLATLREIERDGYQVLSRNLTLTPVRKLWIAAKTWLVS